MSYERDIMTRHMVWQAALALLGIALIFLILLQLTPGAEPEIETIEVPASGGTYVEGIMGYSDFINPILAPSTVPANPVDQDLSALVFDGLTSLDATGVLSPSLALNWEVSEDGTAYEFHLRKGVTWHDGAPFTAADVAFTVQAMQDPNFQGDPNLAELWRNITVEQPDSHTVRFTLNEPFPSFLYYTTIGILPTHLLSAVPAIDMPAHEFSTQRPVGTGRFMVESISSDQVVLLANKNHWGSEPYMEQLEFWFYGTWEGLIEDYELARIHGLHPPTLQNLSTVIELPELRLYSAQSLGYGIVFLNQKRESVPFFQEKQVRQALLYALDRQALIDQVLSGQGLVANSPIPPIIWGHDPSVRPYGYDPERAIGLLDASGWMDSDGDLIRDKDGVELAFTLLTSEEQTMTQMAQELARQWRTVGVEVTIRSIGQDAVTTFVRNRNFDATLIEIALTADPDPYPLWHSTQAESGQNFSGFANDDADLVMEEARFTADPELRTELYHTFQQVFVEEVPSLLLYYPIYTYAVDAKVRDVQLPPLLHSSDRFRNFGKWYIETEEIIVSQNDQLDKTGE